MFSSRVIINHPRALIPKTHLKVITRFYPKRRIVKVKNLLATKEEEEADAAAEAEAAVSIRSVSMSQQKRTTPLYLYSQKNNQSLRIGLGI